MRLTRRPHRYQAACQFLERNNLLSIILSKALLLADDDKIRDPTILSQINHR